MGGLLEERSGRAAAPAQSSPRCTKCNGPLINGQCTNSYLKKLLTSTQPSYLHNLLCSTPSHTRSTHSSSVVTLSRPPTISSLKITDRSFRYASPRLRNQLPDLFRQPHHSCLYSPPHPLVNLSLSSTSLSSSITPSLFHSRLKNYLFDKKILPTLNRLLLPIGLPS